ncbi:MAG: cell division protein ZapA [Clostridiales Family XIII bacterium]|jgi:cell division protein ZapA (FtsZ GTPase activity inhibitor)|nr:cell division protein ZapA [Clostridiales Family XIII bacterium]
MSGSNKVNVVIFRREYTVSGPKPRDYIVKVADYVDSVMTDMSEKAGSVSPSSLAVLSAVNIADDLFSAKEDIATKEVEKGQLTKDIAHYIDLWEEAKRNFLQHKEDSQALVEQMAGVQEKLNEKAIENERLLKATAEKDSRIAQLSDEKDRAIADIKERHDRRVDEIISEKDARIKELTDELGRRVAQAKAESDARVEELAKAKDSRIEELTKELNKRVVQAKAEKDARVDELTRERNQRIASITAEKDARIEELSKELDRLAVQSTAEVDAHIEKFTKELERRVAQATAEKDAHIEELGGHVIALTEKLKRIGEGVAAPPDDIAALRDKYKEVEGNYFEMQMENIRLKGEIERLNSIMSE